MASMSDTRAIVNLMRHAADRLAEEDPIEIIPPGSRTEYRDRAVAAATAMAYAEAILRTVAAALTEEPS
jgi:hypothetical protein